MPGLVGLVTTMPRELAEQQLRRMLKAVEHEPFYVTGVWLDESLGVYVGWTARKNCFSAEMPLCNERGDVILIFSGEEFTQPGTTSHLTSGGHAPTASGPSYLVHLYEEDGCFPAGLNGLFHGIVVDRRSGSSMLFNDRYGLQRVYTHEAEEGIYFAAEAKSILAVRPELRKLDTRGLGELITCGCVLENRTVFDGIHVLPPASAWTFCHGRIGKKARYFQPSEWESQPQLDPEMYYQNLREVFSRNLQRYFLGPEHIGLSVTGGLDTRMILAWRKSRPGSLPCYSFGGPYRDSQDVMLARRLAKEYQQAFEVIRVGREFQTKFSKYAERTVFLTDGCTDVSCSPVLYVNERAREIAPVRITGNYGGEVMRRVRAFKPVEPLADLFSPDLLPYAAEARHTYASISAGPPLSFALFRQAPWHHFGLFALEQSQLSLRSPYLDNEFVRTLYRAPESACTNDDVCLRLIAEGDPALRRIRTDRGRAGNHSRLSSTFQRAFLEFTFKAEYAYDYGMPQWVAQIDHFFAPLHLERLFLGRHKFYHFRVWYRDALSGYVRDMLLDSRTLSRSIFQKKTIENIVDGHLKGDRNYTSAIHQALTLELLHRLFLDSQ